VTASVYVPTSIRFGGVSFYMLKHTYIAKNLNNGFICLAFSCLGSYTNLNCIICQRGDALTRLAGSGLDMAVEVYTAERVLLSSGNIANGTSRGHLLGLRRV